MKGKDLIYYAYFKAKKTTLYFNEIKELSNLSNNSLIKGLKELVENNILTKEKTKSNTFYKIKSKDIFILKFSEFALNQFNDLNTNVKVPLKNFLKSITNDIFTISLFGSASRKEEKDGSDIDLLIVSDSNINLDKIKDEINLVSIYPISLFQCSIKEFENSDDHLIIQAKKTGFPIFKQQNFYEVIINEFK